MTETHIHTEKQPKARREKQKAPATLAEMLIRLHQQNPEDDRDDLMSRFVDVCLTTKVFHAELAEYWYRLNYGVLIQRPSVTEQERAEQAEQRAREVKETVKLAKKIIITQYKLSTVMPNGKPLRDCIGEEIASWRDQLGRVADKVKPKQKVGDVFKTNAALHEVTVVEG